MVDIASTSEASSRITKDLSYSDTLARARGGLGTAYDPGEPVQSSLSGWKQLGNTWPIPVPDAYGFCNDMGSVRFLVSQSNVSCARQGAPVDLCLNVLNSQRYISSLNVASAPEGSGIAPSVGTVTVRDLATLAETTGTFTATSAGTNSCSNALLEAHYSVTISGRTISSITVDIVTGDLAGTSSIFVQQAFSVKFYSSATVFDRSGNPGYQLGLPVITSNQYVIHNGGFVMGGADSSGVCGTSSLTSGPTFLFGQDQIVSCYFEYTFTELSNACGATNQDTPIFSLQSDVTHIAKYGNIDSSNADDWVAVQSSSSFTGISFDQDTGTCVLPNMMVYDIFYTYTGAKSNPQTKIVQASRSYKQGTSWIFKNKNRDAKQKFFNSVVVNFIQYEEDYDFYEADEDENIKIMPGDLFYPFRASSGYLITP